MAMQGQLHLNSLKSLNIFTAIEEVMNEFYAENVGPSEENKNKKLNQCKCQQRKLLIIVQNEMKIQNHCLFNWNFLFPSKSEEKKQNLRCLRYGRQKSCFRQHQLILGGITQPHVKVNRFKNTLRY
jgi:catechol-2,3-dioxygenase